MFTHLHVTSGYSVRYGAALPGRLVERAVEQGQRELALTDRDTVAGAVRFAQACLKAGVRPLFDTNIMILRRWIDPAELPSEMAISPITSAELSAGPHEVRRNDEQADYGEHAERHRRAGHSIKQVDVRRPHVPWFPAAEQRRYGETDQKRVLLHA